ncbi:MAG TPA: PepSY domain-containing protein [Verrucomicrobiae bacterium]
MKTTLTCLLLGVSLATPAFAEKVEFNQLPEAVQKAITQQKGADVKKITIDKETKDGRTVYEVDMNREDAKDQKLVIAADGSLVKDSDRDNSRTTTASGDYVPRFPRMQSVDMKDVPQAVQATINKEAAGRKVVDIDKETWNGQPVYEVEFAQTGRNAQLHIAANGTVVKSERNDATDRAVRNNDRTVRNDRNNRNAVDRDNKDLQDRTFFMGTQLADLPTAAQATIKREAAGKDIVDIDKETRDGRVVYEVEIKQEGKNIELHVAEDGTILRDSRKEDGKFSKI